jgi:hypoxanthine-DNA glycosylase
MQVNDLQEYKSLAPAVFSNPTTLILVSMPSVDSHLANFYFADKDNRFWPLLGTIYNMPYETRQQQLDILEKNHLALWSAVKSCLRYLSREDTMQDIVMNDLSGFLSQYPSITRVVCVSRETQHLVQEALYQPGISIEYVPSPSAADLWYDSVEKLEPDWKEALGLQ